MSRPSAVKLPFEVWALVAGAFTVALGYGVVAPAIPQYAHAFGVSNLAASGIVSAFALMRLVSAPLAGWVVSRFGERRAYTAGILIVALSTGACALAANYPQLLLLRGAGGVGSIMFTVAATALLIKVSPVEARGRVASLNAAGFLLGGLLGPVFGALVAGFGLRAPFVFYFLTLLAAATVVWVALRGSTLAGVGKDADRRAAMTLGEALRVRQYPVLLGSVFSFGWTSFGVRVSVVPLFVAAAFHGDAAMAAWVLAAYAAGNAILIFPSGRWNDTIGRKPLLIVGMAVGAAAYFAFPASPALWVACLVMLVAGAGSALANPGQQAVLADVVGKRRGGKVVAGYSMSSDLGGVLGPLVAGGIVDAAGFGWAFAVSGALLVASAIAWSLVPDSRALQERPGE
ncbi:MFS transporter [Leucobacter sp. CSA1]|uniref:MFS transporter n=1 Tax=Leucobacter chromiisoli TaxID=2796471 RepID=A0A934Q8V3_9MICO|nr:MFS transporter [Leucobacter chromiisoli]MBK0419996.1 MFS transporter [Leucobacter chromiisoli]